MNPSALVLNFCAAIFLTLFVVLAGYLVYRAKVAYSKRKIAKEVPMYSSPKQVVVQPVKEPRYRLAQAK
jgi:hypothetical protein